MKRQTSRHLATGDKIGGSHRAIGGGLNRRNVFPTRGFVTKNPLPGGDVMNASGLLYLADRTAGLYPIAECHDGYLPNRQISCQGILNHQALEFLNHEGKNGFMPQKRAPASPQPTLKAWRVLRGLKLEQVGNIIGVTAQAVHKWEAGKVPVTLENLALLAQAYGTTPANLLFYPNEAALEEKFRRAHAVLIVMGPEKADRWLTIGEDLGGASNEVKKIAYEAK